MSYYFDWPGMDKKVISRQLAMMTKHKLYKLHSHETFCTFCPFELWQNTTTFSNSHPLQLHILKVLTANLLCESWEKILTTYLPNCGPDCNFLSCFFPLQTFFVHNVLSTHLLQWHHTQLRCFNVFYKKCVNITPG